MAKSLEDMVRERYSHPELQAAVIEDVRKHDHEDKILSGDLTLPSELDAAKWLSEESHWEEADRHSRADSKRYSAAPNPMKHEAAKAETQRLLKGA